MQIFRVFYYIADNVPRINEIENKIGAGLIEEVIMVAEGELGLVDEMIASRVYATLFHTFDNHWLMRT
jgi:hypothetical protein